MGTEKLCWGNDQCESSVKSLESLPQLSIEVSNVQVNMKA